MFIVVAVHSLDSSRRLGEVLAAYTLDNSVLGDSFADDSQHVMLDSWPHQGARMAAVDLDIAANRCFDRAAVPALASIEAENLALKEGTFFVQYVYRK